MSSRPYSDELILEPAADPPPSSTRLQRVQRAVRRVIPNLGGGARTRPPTGPLKKIWKQPANLVQNSLPGGPKQYALRREDSIAVRRPRREPKKPARYEDFVPK